MRYVIQAMVMLGDLVLAAVIIFSIFIPCEIQTKAFILVLVALAINAWKQGGGFSAWRIESIKAFFREAKKAGL
jgi:hypothetical protein